MTPFPNGTGPANADTGPPAPHAAAGTGGTSAIGGAHGRPCLSGAAFRRFTLPALLGLLLLAAPLHAAYGTESGLLSTAQPFNWIVCSRTLITSTLYFILPPVHRPVYQN